MDPAAHGQDPPIKIVTPAWEYFVFMKVAISRTAVAKLPSRRVYFFGCTTSLTGTPIPDESANAPLRFRPPPEHEIPAGPVLCQAGCSTKAGEPQQQTYRDYCKVHKVLAVVGRLILDARAPAPPAAAAPIQPPPVPAPVPIPPTIHPAQPPHAHGAGRGNPVARGRGTAAARPRSLAQPMSNSWVNQRQVVLNEKGPDPKAARQRLEKLEQQSCDFFFYHTSGKLPTKLGHAVTHYPKMQLSSTPLLQGLGMTDNSWMDIYTYAECSWKTLQATAVFLVDKSRPTIIRIRPNLLVELELGECPGIEELLVQQTRTIKRKLDDLVSPPKKRTHMEDTIGAKFDAIGVKSAIVIDASPPPTPTSLPPTTAAGAFASTSTSTMSEPQAKTWPGGYYICEHEAAWAKYNQAKDKYGRNKVSIPGLWDELFPGSTFRHTTVTHWRKFWTAAPAAVKDSCLKAGRKHTGSWQHFVDAVRAHSRGHLLVEPDVEAEASVPTSNALQSPESSDQQSNPIPPLLLPAPITIELCNFCDAEITVRPSLKLDQIMADILSLTQSSPTPQNLNHRTAHLPHIYAPYCRQHELDSRLLPAARAAGWPEKIDYSSLRGRVEVEVLPTLHDLLEEIKESDFFVDALAGRFKKATG
ncbi:hypothetical protein K438DRAFT_1942008 [Mycena galopus ATCC 62051]|nr:hypothetical protein K438DRAFT_1942008 [Mycena galopus ATCC 62051]